MIQGSCLCGFVSWELDERPDSATACNCTACSRFGALWAYGYENEGVRLRGFTEHYRRGASKDWLAFHFCPHCACITHWRALEDDEEGRRRVAVNLRMTLDPEKVSEIPVRRFDGLGSFSARHPDGRCVADFWY